jgi:hypothetical protein
MKTMNKILLAAAVAASFTVISNVNAGERLLSPRAKDNEIQKVSGTSKKTLERGILAGTPRGREQAESLRKVAGTTENTIDRSFVTASPRLREVHGTSAKEFQVAPVK